MMQPVPDSLVGDPTDTRDYLDRGWNLKKAIADVSEPYESIQY
jgi:hypothetical protein